MDRLDVQFRPVRMEDLEGIYQLALNAGFGLTTLPKHRQALEKRIEKSLVSFVKKIEQPSAENYFFVLEENERGRIIGTSAIEAAVGSDFPFYSYRVSKISKVCHSLAIQTDYFLLSLTNDLQGLTEIGTLYLHPDFRRDHNGLLLSRARFLFMALWPERFAEKVIAEMRGVSDEHGGSPFWDSVGAHFFNMSFAQADELSILTNKQFIADLMPHTPIHSNLLSLPAQAVIGQPHKSTLPAMKILEREGFRYNNYVDIFDAGPTIACRTDQLAAIKHCQRATVRQISDRVQADMYLMSNTKLAFRAIKAPAMVTDEGVILSQNAAKHLEVEVGEAIQLVPVKP